MIKVVFYEKDNLICGFRMAGHSGFDEEGRDIICASVSSGAYLTANTLTEIVGATADITVEDGLMEFILKDKLHESQSHLQGLKLHIHSLAQDYKKFISCKTETV